MMSLTDVLATSGNRSYVKTGAVVGPPARTGVKGYPVKVTGTNIEIELEV